MANTGTSNYIYDAYGSSDDEVEVEVEADGNRNEFVNIFPTSKIPETSSISETNSDVFNTNFPITGATTPVTDSDATTPFDETTPFKTIPFTTPVNEDEDEEGDVAKLDTQLKLAVPDGTTFSLVADLNEHYVTQGVKLLANIGRTKFELGRFEITHSLLFSPNI